MEKFTDLLKRIFSLLIMIAMIGGGIIFLMFALALVIGGDMGTTIAVSAKDLVMPYFIRLASLAVLVGLIFSYISNNHSLSL